MIFDRIKALVEQEMNIPAENISLESRIAEDLGADSIDAIELIMGVEEEFDIEISDDEAMNIKTIGNLVEVIEKLTK
ncbi:acyl carrier protein [Haploplasma modicum]|jgi:acyl carrier protein|uniref:acyl carrier protein n=1 Tax=Haploplasma modicum TaxID=2150 RepID=UPI00047BEB07|nr:acyl carrier protein [Haploplasma modicum]MCR1808701.1 acyl carrier protein [Haploplasma modicum]